MKKLPVLIIFLWAHFCQCQITVINTGTSEDLLKISKIGSNYLFNSTETYLGKCYGNCNSTVPLSLPSFSNSNYGIRIVRPDSNTLYLTASSIANLNLLIYKSSNGGNSWTKKIDTVSSAMYHGATAFFDSLNGLCFVDNWKKVETVNGFITYSFSPWSAYSPVLTEVNGDSTLAVVSCGGNCGINISRDRGKTWLNSNGSRGVMIYDVKFLNRDTIFAISATSGQSGCSYLFRSFDGGENFDYKTFCGVPYHVAPPPDLLLGLCAKSKNEIFITARSGYTSNGYNGDGVILKSTDLGETWTRFVTPFKKNLYDIKFMNDSIALVCGDSGLLFKWNSKSALYTGIQENSLSEIQANIYPNPVTEKLTFNINKEAYPLSISLSDVFGNSLIEIQLDGTKNEIDLSKFQKGIYFIRISNSKNQRVFKIIKE